MYPDFVIIGAPKCGTTAMKTSFHRNHPSIWLGGREINFFNRRWAKGLDWYESKFPQKKNGILYGEKTPSYIYGLDQPGVESGRRHCHQRMHDIIPNAKLILCLRNPIDRTYSHWNMEHTHTKNYRLTFEEALANDLEHMQDSDYVRFTDYDFVQKGFYIDYIENLLKYFSRDQIHICITEELKADIECQYNKIYRFLELDEPKAVEYPVRATKYRSAMDDGHRETLKEIFTPYNDRLFEFLGRSIKAWT
jgi:hypothetical protein